MSPAAPPAEPEERLALARGPQDIAMPAAPLPSRARLPPPAARPVWPLVLAGLLPGILVGAAPAMLAGAPAGSAAAAGLLALLPAGLAGAFALRHGRAAADRRRQDRDRVARDAAFRTAVEGMSQGVWMCGADGRLALASRRCAEVTGLPAAALSPGADLPTLRAAARAAGGEGAAALLDRLALLVEAREAGAFVQELDGGRAAAVVHQPLADGGWIATFEDVTARRAAEARIGHMARHDALTGLSNRLGLRERLATMLDQAVAGAGRCAVLHLDLDRFAEVNDGLGHAAGDALLCAAAARIAAGVRCGRGGDPSPLPRGGDAIARLGGDEFAIATAPAFDLRGDAAAEAASLARRIAALLAEPFEVEGQRVVIGASIGVALCPAHGTTAEELMTRAALALGQARAVGHGQIRFFEPGMDARARQRRRLELELRDAVAAGGGAFELHYQPLVSVATRGVTGFEALLRWRHARLGLVPPGEFVALAEEIGLIVPLGTLALRRACAEAAGWPPSLRVAVNLSPLQFRGPGLVEAVAGALAASGLAPARLELEITEGVLLQRTEETLSTLHRLRGLGVRIAMDDFGTGYSSLGYLRSFPFDKVKVDRAFVRELATRPDDVAIVQAVSALCRRLGMRITAEGVETEAQLRVLAAERVGEAQGFLFSPAVPPEEVPALLARLGVA